VSNFVDSKIFPDLRRARREGQAEMHPHLEPEKKTKKEEAIWCTLQQQIKQQPAGKPAPTGNNSVRETETGPATVAS
jgi:hypothetical protein